MTFIAWYALVLSVLGVLVTIGDIGKPSKPTTAGVAIGSLLMHIPIWYFYVSYLSGSR